MLELSATVKLHQGIQLARGVDLDHGLATGSGSGYGSATKKPCSVNVSDSAAEAVSSCSGSKSRFSAGAVSKHDKVQDSFSNSVCGLRSFSHVETGVSYTDKLDLQLTSMLWCF